MVSGDGFGLLGFEWLSKGVQTVLRLGELEWHSSANQMSWSGRLGPKWLLHLGCVILFCGSVFFLVDVMILGGSGRARWHQGQTGYVSTMQGIYLNLRH